MESRKHVQTASLVFLLPHTTQQGFATQPSSSRVLSFSVRKNKLLGDQRSPNDPLGGHMTPQVT